ncbi:alpha/beta fold hydrolase [Janibacter sp. G1551]|uniref:alpha/beta fold hydrolase n=1 Tax=Janibacter sp. G1551 TaxID=3420440 RepID=UPI003D04A438
MNRTRDLASSFTVLAPDGAMVHAREFPSRSGDRDAPTLVLAHGWTLSHGSWLPVIERLQEAHDVRVVAYDQPGHGRSTLGAPRPTIRDLGHVLAAVLDRTVGRGPVVLGGHSMGGMTIMAFAGLHPDRVADQVRGVGLVSTAAIVRGHLSVPGQSLLMGTLAAVPGRLRPPPVPAAVFARTIFGPGADKGGVRAATRIMNRTPARTTGRFFAALDAHDERESLAVLGQVPTEVLVGTRDILTPRRWAKEIADAIPGSRLTEFEGRGHMLTYEETDAVAASLGRLLG